MKPILFPKTATQFNTNGLGRLDFISCQVTEERNGIYELEGTIAETAVHAKQIETESIIVAKPSQGGSLQAFRVYKITKPIGGQFMVYARHISYMLGFITAMPFEVAMSTSACNSALQAFITNAAGYTALDFPFSFWTDVNTAASYKQTEPATIRSRLGGVEGSILDQFGGEYEWNNFQVKLHKKRGLSIPQVTLRYGKNITDLQQEENIENTVTGIVPFWTDAEGGDIVTLPEKIIEVQNASSFPFKKTIPYDFSQSFETKPTESQLRSKAQAYVSSSDIGVPKVSIKLSFINLADTEEFKEIAPLQSVNLCDEINVQFEKLGINTTAEIVKTEYDVLREKYNSIEIGSLRSSLAKVISGNMENIDEIGTTTKEIIKKNNEGIDDKIDEAIQEATSDFPTTQKVGQMIDDATTWLTSGDGYVVAVKDPVTHEWQALLFMDSPDIDNAHNVLKVNTAGIGFSRNGVNGPYTQAWTLDGRLIVGGTNVPSFTVYDANNNVIFQTTAAGTIWNSTNSSMTQNGTLTIKNATISGGTLAVLDPNWTPQTPGDQPTDDDYLFKVNSSGLLWNLTNSAMATDGTLTVKNAIVNKGYLRVINPNYESYHDPDPEHVYVYDPKYPEPSVQYLLQLGNYTTDNYDSAGLEIETNKLTVNQDGEFSTKDDTLQGTQTKCVLIDGHIKGYSNNKSQNPPNSTLYDIFDVYPKKDANGDGLQIDGNIRVNGSVYVPNSNGWAQGDSESMRLYDVDGNAYKLTFNRGICTYCGLDL